MKSLHSPTGNAFPKLKAPLKIPNVKKLQRKKSPENCISQLQPRGWLRVAYKKSLYDPPELARLFG